MTKRNRNRVRNAFRRCMILLAATLAPVCTAANSDRNAATESPATAPTLNVTIDGETFAVALPPSGTPRRLSTLLPKGKRNPGRWQRIDVEGQKQQFVHMVHLQEKYPNTNAVIERRPSGRVDFRLEKKARPKSVGKPPPPTEIRGPSTPSLEGVEAVHITTRGNQPKANRKGERQEASEETHALTIVSSSGQEKTLSPTRLSGIPKGDSEWGDEVRRSWKLNDLLRAAFPQGVLDSVVLTGKEGEKLTIGHRLLRNNSHGYFIKRNRRGHLRFQHLTMENEKRRVVDEINDVATIYISEK